MSRQNPQPAVLEYNVVSNRFRAKNLEPTDAECARLLAHHPALTKSGYYRYERYQHENDWRAGERLSLRAHSPPVPITDPEVRRFTGLVRAWLREIQTNIGEPSSGRLYLSSDLQRAVSRWAGEYIPNGAVIAGAFLEGYDVSRYGTRASAIIGWLSLPPELHAVLSAVTKTVLAHMEGALAALAAARPDC
jgi:hypothetical protein